MRIKILKSKIKNIKITASHINNTGMLKLSEDLLDEGVLVNGEKVTVINNMDNKTHHAFIETLDSDVENSVIVSTSIGGPSDTITIISSASVDIDTAKEFNAIIIDKDKAYV